jgi:hypothetical protein
MVAITPHVLSNFSRTSSAIWLGNGINSTTR